MRNQYDHMVDLPNLSAPEEKRLLRRAQNGDLQARNRLVEASMGLVIFIANKQGQNHPDFDDYVSEGSMALMRSIDAIDITRKIRLSSYAWKAIHRAIWRAATKKDMVSLDKEIGDDSEEAGVTLIIDHKASVEFKAVEDAMIVAEMLDKLNKSQRHVVELYFGLGEHLPHTYYEMAEELSVSPQGAQQKLHKALRIIDPTFLSARAEKGTEGPVPVAKVCKVCEIEKPIKDFDEVRYASGRTGWKAGCKVCRADKKRLERLKEKNNG